MAFIIDDILKIGSTILDKVIPDANERAKAQARLLDIQHEELMGSLQADTNLALAQIEVNKAEASNPSLFVSGARPMGLWICNFLFLFVLGLLPGIAWLAGFWITVPPLPSIPMEPLITVYMTLIGARTVERWKGVHREN